MLRVRGGQPRSALYTPGPAEWVGDTGKPQPPAHSSSVFWKQLGPPLHEVVTEGIQVSNSDRCGSALSWSGPLVWTAVLGVGGGGLSRLLTAQSAGTLSVG